MRLHDGWLGGAFLVAGAALYAATLGYPRMDGGQPGPALFPRIVGALLALFGALLALHGLRAGVAGERVAWRALHRSAGFVNALFVLGMVVAYLLLADRLGFLLTSALVLFVLMWRLRVPPVRAAVVAVLFTVFVYAMFVKGLRVPLPTGLLWW